MNTTTQTPAAEYDRELIADMLGKYADLLETPGIDQAGHYHSSSIDEQMRLLQAADYHEAHTVSTRALPASAPKAEGGLSEEAITRIARTMVSRAMSKRNHFEFRADSFTHSYNERDAGMRKAYDEAARSFGELAYQIADQFHIPEREILTRELPAASLGEATPIYQVALSGPLGLAWLDANRTGYDLAIQRGNQKTRVLYTTPPAPAPSSAGEGDWPEDFAHENGNYSCRCVTCGKEFIGHKRRVVCRKCHTPKPEAGAVGDGEVARIAQEMHMLALNFPRPNMKEGGTAIARLCTRIDEFSYRLEAALARPDGGG